MKKLLLGTLVCGVAAFAAVNTTACKGCHGANFEKHALGKSKVVKDLNATEIATALKGYKAGTYNSAGMAGVMKGQVSRYSDTELEQLAKLIKPDTNTTK